ncbi:hypothetical protein [Anaerotignum sp.]|uniref:hypothetical protein n=1 Tax=Anaerotignum sp. TaxID=2039241 RepID=UPI002A90A3CA|nr:hypothetical protein [Anaerotignum sp.]MDY5415082.1 hypothetical protein [Anaerotignum sp.]
MEELFGCLVIAVEQQSSTFSWSDVISTFLSFSAILVTIILWQKERYDRNCPHIQISFELVRSTLACIILRNVSEVPLEVKSLVYNDNFTTQLPEKVQMRLKKMSETNIAIFPGQKWVVSFDVNVFDIVNRFEIQTVEIQYEYCRYGKKKRYKETMQIDFSEYSGILVYISDVDEFKNSVDRLEKTVKRLTTVLEKDGHNGQECN